MITTTMQAAFTYDGTPHLCILAYKFTGKERDQESGLDYFGARYYGSSMGRWMSPDYSETPDPVPYAELGNPQSLNLYGYLNNNPLNDFDEDGHDGALPTATCSPAWLCAVVHFLGKLGGPGDGPAPGSGPGDYWPNPYGRQVAQGVGARANAAAPVVAGGAIISAAAVAGPILAVESAGSATAMNLAHFSESEIETTIESANQPASNQISQGARALAKKLGHAGSGGYQSAFEGVEGQEPASIIRNIMSKATRVVRGGRTTDIYNAAGRGVRIDSATGRFIGFLEKGLATR